jgi:hypothetical protein
MTILFQDLLESLGIAIKKVQTAMDSFQLDSYKDMVKYKDTPVDENGNEQQVRKLKTISMPIPDRSGKTTVRELPLAALLGNDALIAVPYKSCKKTAKSL